MSVTELQWLIGLAVTFFATYTNVIIGVFYRIGTRMSHNADKLYTKIDHLDEELSRVRDKYVRRDDLDSHLTRIDTAVKDLRAETAQTRNEMNQRLDLILSAVGGNGFQPK